MKNPVLPNNTYDWDGHYSPATLSSKNNTVKFFKIHGSFSHVIFLGCKGSQPHIFKLPQFLTAFNIGETRKKLKTAFYHFNINHYPKVGCKSSVNTGYYVHFIDWLINNRDAFEKELEFSISDIQDTTNVEMIISVGFTGRPDEELCDELIEN